MRIQKSHRSRTKFEQLADQRKHTEYHQKGEGLFLFRNKRRDATLDLPKAATDGRTRIEPNGTWEGDNYFMALVKSHDAILVKEIKSPNASKAPKTVVPPVAPVVPPTVTPEVISEGVDMSDKLILDQPEQVTQKGTVEHVISEIPEKVKLTEGTPEPNSKPQNVLLNEDPMAGIQIL